MTVDVFNDESKDEENNFKKYNYIINILEKNNIDILDFGRGNNLF